MISLPPLFNTPGRRGLPVRDPVPVRRQGRQVRHRDHPGRHRDRPGHPGQPGRHQGPRRQEEAGSR